MNFYYDYWQHSYEQLKSFQPRFYDEVFEMDAILKAHGYLEDVFKQNLNQAYLNCFLDEMDDATTTKMEEFLRLKLHRIRTLETRRRFIKCFFVGFGKLSATKIKALIHSYTEADVECTFEPFDDAGNNCLNIIFQRGDLYTLYIDDIYTLLSYKIPAHIEWRPLLTYKIATVIENKIIAYPISYLLSGTKPELANLGKIGLVDCAADSVSKNFSTCYKLCGTTVTQ